MSFLFCVPDTARTHFGPRYHAWLAGETAWTASACSIPLPSNIGIERPDAYTQSWPDPQKLVISPPINCCSHCLFSNMGTLEPFVDRMSLQSPQQPLELGEGRISIANTSAATWCRNEFTLEPFVEGCRGDFDFTVLFELVILSIVPSVCFLVLSSYRIWHLRRKPVLVRGSLLSFGKLVSDCDYHCPLYLLFSRQRLKTKLLRFSSHFLVS